MLFLEKLLDEKNYEPNVLARAIGMNTPYNLKKNLAEEVVPKHERSIKIKDEVNRLFNTSYTVEEIFKRIPGESKYKSKTKESEGIVW